MGHVLDTLAEMDENAALLSVDGARRIRPHLSEVNDGRASRRAEWGQVASICVPPQRFSVHFLVGGREATVNFVPQGEGREQGDPLTPILFSLGQHRGLCAVAERLRPGEQRETLDDSRWVRW